MSSWTVRCVLPHSLPTPFSKLSLRKRREISCYKKGQKGKGSTPMLPVHKLVNIPSAGLKKLKANSEIEDGFRTGKGLEKPVLKETVSKR